jgi:VWFA-related protein
MKNELTLLMALSLLVLPAVTLSQDQELLPQRTKKTEFQQQVAVNYILVDVIVTDKDGNYVHNLTRDDFELLENGKPVRIESLDEFQMMGTHEVSVQQLAQGEYSLEQPPRNIVIFFDLLYSSTYGIKRSVEMAEKFILDRLQPGDHIMVVSYSQSLQTVQPFTADKTKAIDAMHKMGLTTTSPVQPMEPPAGKAPGEAPGLRDAKLYSPASEMGESIHQATTDHLFAVNNARNYLLSMEALAKSLRSYPGRKTVVLLSEGLNYDLLDPIDKNFEDFGPLERQNPDTTGFSATAMKRPNVSMMPFYKQMVEILNDAKVSVYTINVGGLAPLGNAEGRFGGADPLSEQQDVRPELTALSKQQEFLSGVAVDTGGRSYFNTNDILKLLEQVEVDISNYYILGYRSGFDLDRSQYRKITVRAKNPDYAVLHRKGFYTPRPFKSLAAEERDLHLTEGFLTRNQINDLGANVSFQFVRFSPQSLKACVCISVPADKLQIDDGKVDFEVLASNINSEGKIFKSVHKQYMVSGADSADFAEKGLRIVETLDSTNGINRLRIALRDNNTGKLSYFYYNYIFGELDRDTLLLSQPFFFVPGGGKRAEGDFDVKTSLLKNWNEPPGGGAADPIRHPEFGMIFPEIEPKYTKEDQVNFFALLYNLGRSLSDASELKIEFALSPLPIQGEERVFYKVNIPERQIFRIAGVDGIAIVGSFPMEGIEAGIYDLFVLVADNKNGRTSASASRLKFVD